jgi:hypothetical protein
LQDDQPWIVHVPTKDAKSISINSHNIDYLSTRMPLLRMTGNGQAFVVYHRGCYCAEPCSNLLQPKAQMPLCEALSELCNHKGGSQNVTLILEFSSPVKALNKNIDKVGTNIRT